MPTRKCVYNGHRRTFLAPALPFGRTTGRHRRRHLALRVAVRPSDQHGGIRRWRGCQRSSGRQQRRTGCGAGRWYRRFRKGRFGLRSWIGKYIGYILQMGFILKNPQPARAAGGKAAWKKRMRIFDCFEDKPGSFNNSLIVGTVCQQCITELLHLLAKF